MGDFLTSLSTYRDGIFMLMLCLAFLALFVQWLAWIFSIGRFRQTEMLTGGRQQNLRYIFSEAAVKIINDFRHLLALIVVGIFAFSLVFAMTTMSDMGEALKTVVATLGGLVGSIIGYYFGESAASKMQQKDSPPASIGEPPPSPAVQMEDEPIQVAPRPPMGS